jgi:hypothetical protein
MSSQQLVERLKRVLPVGWTLEYSNSQKWHYFFCQKSKESLFVAKGWPPGWAIRRDKKGKTFYNLITHQSLPGNAKPPVDVPISPGKKLQVQSLTASKLSAPAIPMRVPAIPRPIASADGGTIILMIL